MTTFYAIGITTGVSAGVCALSFAFFGCAVRARSINIAPRCAARPKDTIYNPKAKRGKGSFLRFGQISSSSSSSSHEKNNLKKNKKKKQEDAYISNNNNNNNNKHFPLEDEHQQNEKTREEIQYRGTAIFGWIPWVLSLSYDQLLTGVPGTGTRKGGLEGNLLKVNLDGIVLLRFHALCLRVAIVATIIGIGLILPLNITARCYKGNANPLCNSTLYNLTDFQITTLANIPALDISTIDAADRAWYSSWFGSSILIFGAEYSSLLGRLYAVVLYSWIIVFYTLHLINSEWVDALALRRVYYLEGHHWENRVNELNSTVLKNDSDEEDEDITGNIAERRKVNQLRKRRTKKKKQKELPKRPPWIPHPEQRETVPNIELYSVLVGNIPNLAGEIAAGGDLESFGFGKTASVDWQLAVTTAFFDQCVPNQPGFSSSVAAVTILPDAQKLARAWRAWYKHAAMLRRLRYIRRLIAKKRYYDIDEMDDDDSDDEMELQKKLMIDPNKPMNAVQTLDFLFPVQVQANEQKPATQNHNNSDSLQDDQLLPVNMDHLDIESGKKIKGNQFEDEDQKEIQNRIEYYNNVFGSQLDNEDELINTILVNALSYGPEQTAVYSREFAQGAAACCPNGCREKRLQSYSLKQLEELEVIIKKEVQESFHELNQAQYNNLVSVRDLNALKNEAKRHKKDSTFVHRTESVEAAQLTDEYDVEAKLFSQTPKRILENSHGDEIVDDSNMKLNPVRDRLEPKYAVYNTPSQQRKSPIPYSENVSVNGQSLSFNLTNQGKVYFRDANDDTEIWPAVLDSKVSSDDGNNGSRRRLDTGYSQVSSVPDSHENWARVQQIVDDDEAAKGAKSKEKRTTADGVWVYVPLKMLMKEVVDKILTWSKKTKDAVDDLRSDSTFAVVTFTSRQAAIAARHCLVDGRGMNRWTPIEQIPIPPLADAAAFDIKTCRGCCRPVTLTANSHQQFIRKWTTIVMLSIIYVFYTLPITALQTIVVPEKLENFFPGITSYADENPFFKLLLVGILPALGYVVFFALCPTIFKALSNFGSNAISVNHAELIALHYYWFFMAVTAFAGPSLANLAISYILVKENKKSFTSILLEMANGLSSRLSSVWLNWILLRTLVVLPLQYLVQINTFIFQWFGWHCCRRCSQGGGPGGPVPYRIYVDSGVVFMCIAALAPVTPIIAPVAMLYFLFCAPLWRRNCIFMYRPKFDTGGLRWPFLTDVLLTSLVVGQILLTTVMALKEAVGPAFCAAVPIIVIVLNRRWNRKRYLKAYTDAALLQTSQLDGWDTNVSTSLEKREEYRKFLVDAHKAAYVPICIAGGATAALTAEPALVVPHPNDVLIPAPMENHPPKDTGEEYYVNMQPNVYPSEQRVMTPLINFASPPTLSHQLSNRAKNQMYASTRRLGVAGIMNETSILDRQIS